MRQLDQLPPGACTIDHEGCVVCSDAGIPLRVIAFAGDDALCEDAAGQQASIAVELVAPVRVGEVLLTHGGVAIGRVARMEKALSPVLLLSAARRRRKLAERRPKLGGEERQRAGCGKGTPLERLSPRIGGERPEGTRKPERGPAR